MRNTLAEKGFTLIDSLVSMALLCVGANAILGVLVLSVMTARGNVLNAHAVTLAVQEREDVRSLVYSAIASRDPYTTAAPNVFNGVAFKVRSDVQNDQPASNMKTLTVTVSWSFRGQPRSFALQTAYTNING